MQVHYDPCGFWNKLTKDNREHWIQQQEFVKYCKEHPEEFSIPLEIPYIKPLSERYMALQLKKRCGDELTEEEHSYVEEEFKRVCMNDR